MTSTCHMCSEVSSRTCDIRPLVSHMWHLDVVCNTSHQDITSRYHIKRSHQAVTCDVLCARQGASRHKCETRRWQRRMHLSKPQAHAHTQASFLYARLNMQKCACVASYAHTPLAHAGFLHATLSRALVGITPDICTDGSIY